MQLPDWSGLLLPEDCYVALSNSWTSEIQVLYGDFNPEMAHAARVISCGADSRGKIREYFIWHHRE